MERQARVRCSESPLLKTLLLVSLTASNECIMNALRVGKPSKSISFLNHNRNKPENLNMSTYADLSITHQINIKLV